MNKDSFKLPTGSRESRIRQNVTHRQNLKKKWDKKCKYEAAEGELLAGAHFSTENFNESEDNYVRLLDEGVVVDGDGFAYAVIKKGTLKAWYDNLSSKFVGKINKDHLAAIDLGTFTKKDLRLVELDNDRYGIDVNVRLDDNLYAVKDLKRMMNRKALSSEFYWDAEQYVTAEAATGDEKQGKFLIPVIDKVLIDAYAVVDNPKNANSYDEHLLEKASAEGEDMNEDELKKAQLEAEEATEEVEVEVAEESSETAADESAESDVVAADGAAESEAEKTEASAEEGADESAEGEAAEEEGEAEEATEETEQVEAAADDAVTLEKLAAAVEGLKADYEAVKAENAQLKATLSAKEDAAAAYQKQLQELFQVATTDEPATEEGGETDAKTTDETPADAYEAALAEQFKAMEG